MNQSNHNQGPQSRGAATGRPRRLYRSVGDRKIAGVCGGIAEYLGIDPLLVRILWAASCVFGLLGLFVYIIAWMVIPDNPEGASAAPRPPSRSGRYVWGTVLIVLGILFLADQHDFYFLVPWRWHYFVPHWVSWGLFFAVMLVALGVILILRGTGVSTPATTGSGTGTAPESESTFGGEKEMSQKRLHRSLDDRMVGGVCGGLAEYFNIDPSLVRVGWVLATFFSGFFMGIIAYVVLMVVVPEQRPEPDGPRL